MHLAALYGRADSVGTYFAVVLGVVGGGPPLKQNPLKRMTKKPLLKSSSNVSSRWALWAAVGYSRHGCNK